jgi:glutamyl-tRNA(Gln) amidotransferase subunit E
LSNWEPTADKVRVGLEIHQQLSSGHKLFCSCGIPISNNWEYSFDRKLRLTRSEVGTLDPAAIFESKKSRTTKYFGDKDSNCLVEADEEPPYSVNTEALETCLIVSLALNSAIQDEFHVMRKIVIDGSNTTGFQRTTLIAKGGYIDVEGKKIGVQTICLEEDAARIVKRGDITDTYALDRLGVPLVEIALEPISGPGQLVSDIALAVGRLLRSTKRVARGIGTIRQDVNISVNNGPVVEVKGVQQLSLLPKVIEYESLRQISLNKLAVQIQNKLSGKQKQVVSRIIDVTHILRRSNSLRVKHVLEENDSRFMALLIPDFKGILGLEFFPGIRLGKQLSELVRFYGLGGIFHSDELPKYGISANELSEIEHELGKLDDDAFILIGGSLEVLRLAVRELALRLKCAINGVVAETRSVADDGSTVYMRPRPGSARMYPETDIPYFSVPESYLNSLDSSVPLPWPEIISNLCERYKINAKLAKQIYDSDYLELFYQIAALTKIPPSFIVSKLTDELANFHRQGFDLTLLQDDIIKDTFMKVDGEKLGKESVTLIIEKILNKEASNADEAIALLGIETISSDKITAMVDEVILENQQSVIQKRNASQGLLMGRCMARLRGKVDGQTLDKVLKERLWHFLKKNAAE